MQPTMIPIVFTDAVSNWRITSAAVTQRIPVTSHSHQNGRTARARTSTSGGWAMVSCTVAWFTGAWGAARASACVRVGCAHPPAPYDAAGERRHPPAQPRGARGPEPPLGGRGRGGGGGAPG